MTNDKNKTIKGKAGEWYEDDNIGGFIRDDGTISVCIEKNLTHADTDAFAVDVQNGDGYYDNDGWYRRFG